MTNELHRRRSLGHMRRIRLRAVETALALAAVLVLGVTPVRSQEAAKPPTYSVLYTFTGGADGANLFSLGGGDLTLDPAGNLYGTAVAGGDSGCTVGLFGPPTGCGVVFELDRAGKQTVLHTFTGPDGANPAGGAVRDKEGNLYGSTVFGGDLSGCFGLGCGVVFKLDRAGKETVLYSFTGGADGALPERALLLSKGNLYGITVFGAALSALHLLSQRAAGWCSSWTRLVMRRCFTPSAGERTGGRR